MFLNGDFKPKFSIIMAVYNVEKWLDEAVVSILQQENISFENDVEILLINDCSPDNSEDICKKYSSKYPNNVKYYKNSKNLGLSGTRNKGLSLAKGKYINFFDPDDTLSKNVLSEVLKFFEKKYMDIAHVSIPLIFFEAATGLHPKYKHLGKKNRVINLLEEPSNFILSSASSFYLREKIINKTFDTTLFGEEDTLFNFNLYSECSKVGYIVENGVCYNYRRRKEGGSLVNLSIIKPEAYYTPINLLKKINISKNIELYYELVVYQLRSRLKSISPSIFNNVEDYNEIINDYVEIIRGIPKTFIINKTKFLDNDLKILFLTECFQKEILLESSGDLVCDNYKIMKCNDLFIDVKNIELDDDNLIIEVLFNDYGVDDLNVVIRKNKNKTILPKKSYKTDSIHIKKIGELKSCETIKYFRFELSMKDLGEYQLYFRNKKNGYLHVCSKLRTYSGNPFLPNSVFNSKLFKLYSNYETACYLFNKKIVIEKSSLSYRFFNMWKAFKLINKKHKVYKWLRLLKNREAKYWLFNDRPINANDNAEALFTYINQNRPDIADKCYFVLSKKSEDLNRIKKIGNVVIQNSFKHKYLYLNSKYIFTSHLATSFFKPISHKFVKYYNDLIESKIIWLQHGVTMNDIESAANNFNKNINKIVVSANYEKKIFLNPKYFYQIEDILDTGFSRHDNLIGEDTIPNKEILIMPTWRSYLSGKILSNGLHAKINGFEDSEYFKQFSLLLSNLAFNKLLEKTGYKVNFVLHPGFRVYSDLFKKYENNNIKITSDFSVSYSELFKKSSILVTDYSSVFFDFSYMKKPCVFFQFDSKEFYGKHYKKGIFDFDSMAPGPVYNTVIETIQYLEELVNNNSEMEGIYEERVNCLYKYIDTKNSKRLLNRILTK